MPLYTSKLGSPDGRIVKKDFEAASVKILRQSLEEQGFSVFELREKPFQFLWDKGIARRRVDNKTLLTFNQELLVLIKAGLPIIQVLDTILERLEKGKLPEILREVREDIKGGASLSDAFEKHPKVFPHLYVASIRAGERTGDLPQNIRRYTLFLKRIDALRKKLYSAMIYPAVLVFFSVVVVSVLFIFVVPEFSKVFADAGTQLPLATRILIAVAGIIKKYILLLIILGITGLAMFRRWAATEAGRFRVDGLKLKIPLIGDIWGKYSVASFTRTFASVLASGIPIVESLKMCAGTLNNKVLERKLLEAVVRVEEGTRLSIALESARLMPPLAIRMLGVGETTGSLEEMLADISEYFEDEIDGRLTVLTSLIEPVILICMGLFIGTIVITMYLPVFKLAGAAG